MAAFPDSIRRYAIHRLSRLAHTRWDVFHRTIRDIKLSLQYACKGAFLQVQMRSNYLWAQPVGVGVQAIWHRTFMQHKTRLLACHAPAGVSETCDLLHTMFEEVWSELSSCWTFHCKGTMPKLGRWFAWNDAAEEQLSEFPVYSSWS